MPARPAVPALGRTSPIRRARHESLSAQTAQPSPQTPVAVKIVQTGDPADHQNPSRQREKRQGENFRFIGARLQEAAIVPASGEEAQKGVGVNAGGGIDEHLGLVVAGGAQPQLSPVKPAGGRVGLHRRINRAGCGCRRNGMMLRRPCFRSGNRRWPDEDRGGMRVDERGSCRTCGLYRQNRRQHGGQNRDDDKAWQVDPHSPGARANPTPGRTQLSRDRRMGTLTKKYNKITRIGCRCFLAAADIAKALRAVAVGALLCRADQICWIAESSHWPPRLRTKVHSSSASTGVRGSPLTSQSGSPGERPSRTR